MKELKEKILALLAKHNINLSDEPVVETEQAVAKVKCATAVLEDGSEIFTESDAWALGVNVYTTNADGTESPLADGEYVLADGTKLVAAGGVVAELEAPKADNVEDEPTDMTEQLNAVLSLVANLEKQVAELTTAKTALSAENETLKAELSKTPAAPSVTAPVVAPTATPVVVAQSNQKPFHKMSYVERVNFNLNKNK